jgi:hypothetical protein
LSKTENKVEHKKKKTKLLQQNKKRKGSADLGLGCIAISKIISYVWCSFAAIILVHMAGL